MKRKTILFVIGFLLFTTGCGKDKLVCKEGELEGDFCVIKEISDAQILCDTGYRLDSTIQKCVKEEVVDAEYTFSCSDGYYLSGASCYSNESKEKVSGKRCATTQSEYNEYIKSTPTTGFYGSKEKGNQCIYEFCNLSIDGRCVNTVEREDKMMTISVCPSDTVAVGNECKLKEKGKIHYYCKDGYTLVDDNHCAGTETRKPNYICENGSYNEETQQCEKKIEEAPQKK